MEVRTEKWPGTAVRPIGLVSRQKGPNNLEVPFDQLGDFITPTRTVLHAQAVFHAPAGSRHYRLSIGGRTQGIEPKLRGAR
jgi:hypothetical protein